ncbi:MAG: hypothetical protein LBL74_05355 [Bacteroidales bacterium]|nr:hypothetical protein [Bacteroidales bacterium]
MKQPFIFTKLGFISGKSGMLIIRCISVRLDFSFECFISEYLPPRD